MGEPQDAPAVLGDLDGQALAHAAEAAQLVVGQKLEIAHGAFGAGVLLVEHGNLLRCRTDGAGLRLSDVISLKCHTFDQVAFVRNFDGAVKRRKVAPTNRGFGHAGPGGPKGMQKASPKPARRSAGAPETEPATPRRKAASVVKLDAAKGAGGLDAMPELKEADAKTMGEGAYARLRSDLIAGRIVPGTRLPFRQLSDRYKVGIGPLREALMRLASERLVAFEGQRGFMASPLSLDDLNDLCSLRIDLSCRALRDSITRGGEDWEDEILVSLHRMERSPLPKTDDDDASIDEWERRHDRFHTSLIAACGSGWLLHFCATLSDQFQRYRRFTVLRMAQSYSLFDVVRSQHRGMAEAALDRRADEAVEMLKAHYEGSLKNVTEQIEHLVNRKRT
ncbi:MAG: hypothetical protein B7Y84_06465 [Azorhizobium sp. 32-67-21]|nr:MAG: hypothetical protein B7Y84_06465 [Azorhizobium sp. 32-67-21]OYY08703.1 MAG: hypothetical protein B7Y70_11595 [Rhizobiales bacterium 35-68-8]